MGHSYDFNDNDNWELIEEFAEKVGNRDDVWYANNMEVYNYVKAYDSLEYSLDGKLIYNPSGINVIFIITAITLFPQEKPLILQVKNKIINKKRTVSSRSFFVE